MSVDASNPSVSAKTNAKPLFLSAPYIGIHPPKDMTKYDRSKVVYGFPLTEEWLEYRYHHEVVLEFRETEGVQVESRNSYLCRLLWQLPHLCQKIHQVKCTTTIVETRGRGKALFLVVGYPGRKPPPDTLDKLVHELAEYAIVERPGWYPRE